MKKLVSAMLAAVMAASFMAVSAASAGTAVLSIKPSATEVPVGSEVTITVNVDKDTCAWQTNVNFDPKVFTFDAAKSSVKSVAANQDMTACEIPKGADNTVTAFWMDGTGGDAPVKGDVATLTFKVNEGVEVGTKATFATAEINVGDPNNAKYDVEAASVELTVAAKADSSSAAPADTSSAAPADTSSAAPADPSSVAPADTSSAAPGTNNGGSNNVDNAKTSDAGIALAAVVLLSGAAVLAVSKKRK